MFSQEQSASCPLNTTPKSCVKRGISGTLLNSPSRHLQLCSKQEGTWDGRGNCAKGDFVTKGVYSFIALTMRC